MNYVNLLERGIDSWNRWRDRHPHVSCDLSGQDLSEGFYFEGNFSNVSFKGAKLRRACLIGANLQGADLSGSDLSGAYLGNANLSGANLSNARLSGTNLNRADLRQANLQGTQIFEANTYKALFSEDDNSKEDNNAVSSSAAAVQPAIAQLGAIQPIEPLPPAITAASTSTIDQLAVQDVDSASSHDSSYPLVAEQPSEGPIRRQKPAAWMLLAVVSAIAVLVSSSVLFFAVFFMGRERLQIANKPLPSNTAASKPTAPIKQLALVQSFGSDSQVWAVAAYTPLQDAIADHEASKNAIIRLNRK